VRAELIAYVDDQGQRLRTSTRQALRHGRDRLRAAAGELPRPLDLLDIARQRLDLASSTLAASLRHLGQQKRLRLATVGARLSPNALRADLRHAHTRLSPCAERLEPGLRRILAQRADRLAGLGKLLDSLSYKGVLARGYALVLSGDEIVRSPAQVEPGAALSVQVAEGEFGVTVAGAPPPRKKPRPPAMPGGEQESLF